jgi:hypothetical protein
VSSVFRPCSRSPDRAVDFKSKKIRVNLNLPIKAEVKAETSEVMKSVDEDRKYVIQATIVRIMKARKTMKNQPLIQEVIAQISQRFAPKIPDIKKAIDTLLEKEYIERVDGTRDTFNYVVRHYAPFCTSVVDVHFRRDSSVLFCFSLTSSVPTSPWSSSHVFDALDA